MSSKAEHMGDNGDTDKPFATFDEFFARADLGWDSEHLTAEAVDAVRPALALAIAELARAMLREVRCNCWIEEAEKAGHPPTITARFFEGDNDLGAVDLITAIEKAVQDITQIEVADEIAVLERLQGIVSAAIKARHEYLERAKRS